MPEDEDQQQHVAAQRESSPQPPPLPRRPTTIEEEDGLRPPLTPSGSVRNFKGSPRPPLQSKATTAVSQVDVLGLSQDASPSNNQRSRSHSRQPSGRLQSRAGSDDDTASVRSVQTLAPGQSGDIESLLDDVVGAAATETDEGVEERDDAASLDTSPLQNIRDDLDESFSSEFEPVGSFEPDGSNGELLNRQWRAKLKHYLILSSAGKPIYSRHGDDQLISGTIGVVQTIISFYQGAQDTLRGFTAGDARFVILSKGHLHLLAISRLGESEAQLRAQLEALYMQILSTLTLPTMEKMFINRPSTDLRRPLQGTESLISSLADGFTRGSPATLLSALECLRIRKAHRQVIHSTLLKCRSPQLLYGLVVADGRLAAVVRPKKHSLHPGDLHLIFNMLFEADSVRAGGGENWIPLCLPGFNNTGYLYMYVSFIDPETGSPREDIEQPLDGRKRDNEIAVLLISANREAFDEMREMRDKVVDQLQANGSLAHIRRAIANGRSSCTSILNTNKADTKGADTPAPIAHFLYKSRANVQFVMPSAGPLFSSTVSWRRLISLYARLQGALHGKTTHLKVVHVVTGGASALAWTTPTFEVYVVAGPRAGKHVLAKAAMGVVQWARREEERLFVVGGAVF
ncbi:hypothetical protein FH972_022585 [Carpinus fangiana]|uniref:Vacuolar fusion protein MON1 homolog n=1 Tax=Carpinus fangiana TaxID=176857 RepID=A0A5N6KT84_9ROSI|nr:hypothetical protein FH972_022585 [Carpinus fangiana]